MRTNKLHDSMKVKNRTTTNGVTVMMSTVQIIAVLYIKLVSFYSSTEYIIDIFRCFKTVLSICIFSFLWFQWPCFSSDL